MKQAIMYMDIEEWIVDVIGEINNCNDNFTHHPIPLKFCNHIQREVILKNVSASVGVDIIRIVDFTDDADPRSGHEPFRKYLQTRKHKLVASGGRVKMPRVLSCDCKLEKS